MPRHCGAPKGAAQLLCGESSGHYDVKGVNAHIRGPARVLGMINREYARSLVDPVIPFRTRYDWFPILSEPNHHVIVERPLKPDIVERPLKPDIVEKPLSKGR